MNTQIKVQFYLRKSRINANGLIPVYQKILINKKPFDIGRGFYVLESSWSKETDRIKRSSEETRTINRQLEKLNDKVILQSRSEVYFKNEIALRTMKYKLSFRQRNSTKL